MNMDESQEQKEGTVGIGKLLGLFFGLVVICAVALGIGFSLGHSSPKRDGSLISDPEQQGAGAANGTAKPVAGQTATAQPSDCPNGDCSGTSAQQPAGASQELTFYKAVEQKDPNAQLEAPPEPAPAPAPKPKTEAKAKPEPKPEPKMQPKAQQKAQPKAEPKRPEPPTGYMVQVAAVRRQEDAQVLRSALQRKRYPVIITSGASDKLFHVQVGPFPDARNAETMRAKLLNDGYNPILKH